jgi:hypothetical protein
MLHFMLLVRSFNHLSIGAMYEQGPMIFVCREIMLTASCSDGKRQLLDSLRSKFPGGTMNLERPCQQQHDLDIFWRGVKHFGTNFLRVYILEQGVPRSAERENFETLKFLDRRKWHFQTLVLPSVGCRAQKGS